MKLRIIKKSGLFIPQYCRKGYYYNGWVGFCTPNIKFTKSDLAKDFIDLIEKAVPSCNSPSKTEIIYSNPEAKKDEIKSSDLS